MNDYYVAIRRESGTRNFAITARSASSNLHWRIRNNTVTHTNKDGRKCEFSIIMDGMDGKVAKRLKEFMVGALVSSGYTQIYNGA